MKRIISILIFILVFKNHGEAQCTFRILSLEGAEFTNSNQTIWGPYPDIQTCEANRNKVLSDLNFNIMNKKVRATASNCSCAGGNTSGSSMSITKQDGSFFSPNSIDEIKNWSEDYSYKRLALDDDYISAEATSVSTGDSEYDDARGNYSLSGLMPKGSTGYIGNRESFSNYAFPTKRGNVFIPDDLLNGKRPFVSLGGGNSEDLKMYKGELMLVPSVDRVTEKETIDWMELIRDDAKFAWSIYELFKKSGVISTANKSIPGVLINANINVWSETIDYAIKFYNDDPYQEKTHITPFPIINNVIINTLEDYAMDLPYEGCKKIFGIKNNSSADIKLGIAGITINGIILAKKHYDKFKTLWNNE